VDLEFCRKCEEGTNSSTHEEQLARQARQSERQGLFGQLDLDVPVMC
jgi:hypothetical protein